MALRTLACLPAVTGDWAIPGGGLHYSTSGHFRLDVPGLARFDLLPNPVRTLSQTRVGEGLLEAADPPVKALFVIAANPVGSNPQQRKVIEGLSREDLFTVVLEHFPTDTVDYADIVLPATMQPEHLDVIAAYGNLYLVWNEKAVEAPGECLSTTGTFRRPALLPQHHLRVQSRIAPPRGRIPHHHPSRGCHRTRHRRRYTGSGRQRPRLVRGRRGGVRPRPPRRRGHIQGPLSTDIGNNPIGTLATLLPHWFLVPFVVMTVLGLIGTAVLDIYSSGLALMSAGLHVPRYVAVSIDGTIMIIGTIYVCFFAASFIGPFEGFLITLGVPIAAWTGIFLADMTLRRKDYVERDLYDPSGRYGSVRWSTVAVMAVASGIGWGLVTNTSVGWLGWQGFLLGPLRLGGTSGQWAASDIGVIVAVVLGYSGILLTGRRAVRRQELDVGQIQAPPHPEGQTVATLGSG